MPDALLHSLLRHLGASFPQGVCEVSRVGVVGALQQPVCDVASQLLVDHEHHHRRVAGKVRALQVDAGDLRTDPCSQGDPMVLHLKGDASLCGRALRVLAAGCFLGVKGILRRPGPAGRASSWLFCPRRCQSTAARGWAYRSGARSISTTRTCAGCAVTPHSGGLSSGVGFRVSLTYVVLTVRPASFIPAQSSLWPTRWKVTPPCLAVQFGYSPVVIASHPVLATYRLSTNSKPSCTLLSNLVSRGDGRCGRDRATCKPHCLTRSARWRLTWRRAEAHALRPGRRTAQPQSQGQSAASSRSPSSEVSTLLRTGLLLAQHPVPSAPDSQSRNYSGRDHRIPPVAMAGLIKPHWCADAKPLGRRRLAAHVVPSFLGLHRSSPVLVRSYAWPLLPGSEGMVLL
jgi:hypothetical protein